MPTGVRIDQAKVTQWSNDLVRFTDNFPTEKLERVYSAMNKVRLLFSQLLNFSQLGCFKNHFCLFFLYDKLLIIFFQVIRRFRTQSDRTDLPTELQAELQTLKSQERDMRRS